MNRPLRLLIVYLGSVLILVALIAAYALTGTSTAQTRTHYSIVLTAASAKTLAVTMTVTPEAMPFLDLLLRDPVQDGRQRIVGFSATRNGSAVASWQTLPFLADVVRLWNGFSRDPITITYQVDPTWMKGADSPRSYLGPEFAYIRGMVTLYSPISLNDIFKPDFDHPGMEVGLTEAEVSLPQGWRMVSPFGSGKISTATANLRNSYIGFGPFEVQDLTFDKVPFLVGVYAGLPADRRAALGQQVPVLFETMRKEAGFAPVLRSNYWSLAILPTEPIHGGAAGTDSLVVEDNLIVIAHEIFHWWNGATLVTSNEANWLEEGFTSYYAAKSLYQSGLWSNDDFSREIGRFQNNLWGQAGPLPINFIDAANRLTGQNQGDAYNPVYFGGGLLAYFLDQQLKAQGKSLDLLWPLLNNLNRPVTTADFLQVLETVGGADLARQVDAILRGQQTLEIKRSK
jgi:hypothetical protein